MAAGACRPQLLNLQAGLKSGRLRSHRHQGVRSRLLRFPQSLVPQCGRVSPRSLHQRLSRVLVRAGPEDKAESSRVAGDSAAPEPAEPGHLGSDHTAEAAKGAQQAAEAEKASESAQLLARAAASGNDEGSSSPGQSGNDPVVEKIPAEELKLIRERVFGFNTFFVTTFEPYESGVLFRGNLRGESSAVHAKLQRNLEELYGFRYSLFLLNGPEDQRPVVVVLPAAVLEPLPSAVPQWVAASAFGFVSLATVLLAYTAFPEEALFFSLDPFFAALPDALPSALLFSALLAAHEAGHHIAARPLGVQLSLPFFVPSWQIGSFGAITRISSLLPSRSHLLTVAAAGPLAGMAASLLAVLLLLLQAPGGSGAIELNAAAFHESLLVGALAKLLYGPQLSEGAELLVPAPLIAAWAGLLASAINCIPAGELDGGRVAVGLLGRQWGQRLSGLAILLVALAGLASDIALFWFIFIVFLQRGPVQPQADEVTPPDTTAKALGVGALVAGLLVYLPYPFIF